MYAPTILTDVPYDAVASNEESFGPLVIVEPVDTAEDAVAVANRTMYGLTSSILTGDTYRGFELAPRILAGIVNVNLPTVHDEIHAPMGGVRDSGWGRTGPAQPRRLLRRHLDQRHHRGAALPVLTASVRHARKDPGPWPCTD